MRYRQSTPVPLPQRAPAAPPARACPNCGTPVDDRYCPRCGQANRERLVSFRAIVRDLAEDQLSLGGALPRTLGALAFRPGLLTREYAAGRIARYIAPFRLYLVSSLLFFVALSAVAGFDWAWRSMEPFVNAPATDAGGDPQVRENYVLVRMGVDTAAVPGWLRPAARYYVAREAALNRMPPREGARVLYEATASNVPRAMFLAVPLFALFLKGLYRRRLYVEHFVFVLHFHSLGFLLATLMLAARQGWVTNVLGICLLVYLLLAMRRAYAQPWPKTAAKYLALLAGYYVVLFLLIGAVLVAAVLTT